MRKLQVHLYEPMRDVLANNVRANFDPAKESDETPIIWPEDDTKGELFEYSYNDPSGSIHFPHARMVWATQYAGVVTDILVSASAQKVPIPALYTELTDITKQLERAGWHASIPVPSLQTIESSVAATDATGLEGGLLYYTKEHAKVSLGVKGFATTSGKASSSNADYALNVQFSDAHFQDDQQTKAYRERQSVNGDLNKDIPLSYWLNHR